MSFVEGVAVGCDKIEDKEKILQQWKDKEIYRWADNERIVLGLTEEEYAEYLINPEQTLMKAIEKKKNKIKIINDLEDYIENKYGSYLSAISYDEFTNKEYLIKYNITEQNPYGIELWFNDMFGWALSYNMLFYCRVEGIEKQIEKFKEWLALEGKIFVDEFSKVPYPKDNYTQKELDFYFNSNVEIGKRLSNSIDKFCGIDFKAMEDFE